MLGKRLRALFVQAFGLVVGELIRHVVIAEAHVVAQFVDDRVSDFASDVFGGFADA
jgi:hypothetical protein